MASGPPTREPGFLTAWPTIPALRYCVAVSRREVELSGDCMPGFEEVRRVFARSFARREELGASVCVWHQGRKVVDLWGGHRDRRRTLLWQEDTMTTVFSTTKGMVALCFLMLADRGAFSYDEPVATYWPEFAAEGKAEVSIRTLLNHRAGLIAIDLPIRLDDLELRPEYVASLAAAQKPHWQPGTDQGYHGVTYGLYAAELFRRIAGESLGTFLAREVRDPLGIDLHLGLTAEMETRVSSIYPASIGVLLFGMVPALFFGRGTNGRVYRQVVLGRESAKAFGNPAELGTRGVKNFNTTRVHALELPWANAISNARGLARAYAALACGGEIDGVRLVRSEALEPLRAAQSWTACDRVLRKGLGWSQGFVKEEPHMFSPNPNSFGHPGAGGALGWCDPQEELAFAYVPNSLSHHVRSPRARALAAAVYSCVARL